MRTKKKSKKQKLAYLDNKLIFKQVKNPPFCPYIGPFFKKEYKNK